VQDKKYANRVSSSMPNWGRVHFEAKCPNCKKTSECSVQNNTVRPWTRTCTCDTRSTQRR
jgi:hypothetical protein